MHVLACVSHVLLTSILFASQRQAVKTIVSRPLRTGGIFFQSVSIYFMNCCFFHFIFFCRVEFSKQCEWKHQLCCAERTSQQEQQCLKTFTWSSTFITLAVQLRGRVMINLVSYFVLNFDFFNNGCFVDPHLTKAHQQLSSFII